LPCDFCRLRGIKETCVKQPGPKAASRLPVSRLIPTAIDSVIEPEDALLLTYAYTGSTRWDTLSAFLKVLASEYGPSIPFTTLRHAVLASAAHALSSEQFNSTKERHVDAGWNMLSRKFASNTTLNDTEIFAMSILADILWDSSPSSPEALQIVHQSGVILEVAHRSGERSPSSIFTIFGPYFRDGLRFCEITGAALVGQKSQSWMIPERATFQQCRRYYQEFQRIQSSGRTGVIEAVLDTLQEVMHALVCCLHRRSYRVLAGDSSTDEETVARNRIQAEFGNADFLQCIADITAPSLFRTPSNEAIHIKTLITCIRILFTILESVGERTDRDGTATLSRRLISSIKQNSQEDINMRKWMMTYGGCLLVGGMTLCPEDVKECNSPKFSILLISH